jgi:hypothetical protein
VIIAVFAWGAAIAGFGLVTWLAATLALLAIGPGLGDVESGAVAAAFGDTVSAVSGGLAWIVGALVLARLLPGFRRQQAAPSDQPGGTP